MSKHDRNTQIEQDRQNLESADLRSNPPEHAHDANRPAGPEAAASAEKKPRRRVVKANPPGAQAGGSGAGIDELQRQDKPLK